MQQSPFAPLGTSSINLTGNGIAQTVIGNEGANRIDGGAGSDTLTGGGGQDVFVFSTALGAGNIDRITDFGLANDRIDLDDAIFSALAVGTLASTAFEQSTGVATTAAHRILYDRATGALYYDADGNGAGARVQFASLTSGLSLAVSDFAII